MVRGFFQSLGGLPVILWSVFSVSHFARSARFGREQFFQVDGGRGSVGS